MHKILLFVSLISIATLQSREPYHAEIIVTPVNAKVSAPNLVDLTRDLRSTAIESILPIYTPISAAEININLRGILTLGSFAAGSTDFVVQIPQANIVRTFSGGTRDDSLLLYKEFIRDGGEKHRLLRAYARYSPIDPIAGNPNSLLAQMAQADYLVGHLSPLSGCDRCWEAQPVLHQYQSGVYAGRAFSKGFDTTTVTMPLRYSYSPDRKFAFILDAPITYNRNGGASSIFSSLGMGARIPFSANWSFTSMFRFGAGGSLDLCTSGCFVSAGATSVYNFYLCPYVITLTNYAGYFSSTNLWLSGTNFNYHLHHYIFKNGLSVTTCEGLTFCKRPINISLSFEDSYFTRKHLFIRHYDEFEVDLITSGINPWFNYDCLSLGFAYQFGEKHYRGYYLKLTYQF